MGQGIKLNIDTKKINRAWFFEGQKGTYMDLVIYENDREDNYGNSHVVKQNPSKEARDVGEKPIIIGNGKWMQQRGSSGNQGGYRKPSPPIRVNPNLDYGMEDGDIPF